MNPRALILGEIQQCDMAWENLVQTISALIWAGGLEHEGLEDGIDAALALAGAAQRLLTHTQDTHLHTMGANHGSTHTKHP